MLQCNNVWTPFMVFLFYSLSLHFLYSTPACKVKVFSAKFHQSTCRFFSKL